MCLAHVLLHVFSNLILKPPWDYILSLLLFDRWGNRGTEVVSNLPKVTKLIRCMMGFRPSYLDS